VRTLERDHRVNPDRPLNGSIVPSGRCCALRSPPPETVDGLRPGAHTSAGARRSTRPLRVVIGSTTTGLYAPAFDQRNPHMALRTANAVAERAALRPESRLRVFVRRTTARSTPCNATTGASCAVRQRAEVARRRARRRESLFPRSAQRTICSSIDRSDRKGICPVHRATPRFGMEISGYAGAASIAARIHCVLRRARRGLRPGAMERRGWPPCRPCRRRRSRPRGRVLALSGMSTDTLAGLSLRGRARHLRSRATRGGVLCARRGSLRSRLKN